MRGTASAPPKFGSQFQFPDVDPDAKAPPVALATSIVLVLVVSPIEGFGLDMVDPILQDRRRHRDEACCIPNECGGVAFYT